MTCAKAAELAVPRTDPGSVDLFSFPFAEGSAHTPAPAPSPPQLPTTGPDSVSRERKTRQTDAPPTAASPSLPVTRDGTGREQEERPVGVRAAPLPPGNAPGLVHGRKTSLALGASVSCGGHSKTRLGGFTTA